MFELLTNTYKGIEKSSKKKISSIFLWLIFPTVLISIAMWLFSLNKTSKIPLDYKFLFIYAPVIIYVGSMFIAYLITWIVKIMNGKAKYKSGLTALTNSLFVISWWLVLWALLTLISKNTKYQLILTYIMIPILTILFFTVLIKSIMSLFDVELLTSLYITFIITSLYIVIEISSIVIVLMKSLMGGFNMSF